MMLTLRKRAARVVVTTAGAMALAGAATFAVAGPAAAAPNEPLVCVHTGNGGGEGCFKRTGDIVYAIDTGKDGHHVRVDVTPGGGGTQIVPPCENYKGYGTTTTCNDNFPEHTTICLTVSVWEGNALVRSDAPGYRCTSTTY